MAVIIEGDNILSALGETTAENISAIKRCVSGIGKYEDLLFPGCGETMLSKIAAGSDFAERLIRSVERAAAGTTYLGDSRTIFIFSSTKGDLGEPLHVTARKVAGYFGNPNRPVVISNACISGVVAIIVAKRLIEASLYTRAVIVGADEASRFIISGFGCLKALSPERCRPFDAARQGLNLGEAVAALILRESDNPSGERVEGFREAQVILAGTITNDANHISGPSRTAEGLYRAIETVQSVSPALPRDKGFINPHGTATIYNDQMESIGIVRAGLGDMRVSPLKSYYGHTLGAAGVVETILSAHFADEGYLPAPLGYENPGTEPKLEISGSAVSGEFDWFLKLVSGFGGTNAAVKIARSGAVTQVPRGGESPCRLYINKSVRFRNEGNSREYLNGLYREFGQKYGMKYPKFHKMDLLCKGGILAMQELVGSPFGEAPDYAVSASAGSECGPVYGDADTALLFLNNSSSKAADEEFLGGIAPDNFYPSPAVFVYTLPSVVIGEISIRYKFYGEGTFFISDRLYGENLVPYIGRLFGEGAAKRVIVCWDEVTESRCEIAAVVITASETAGCIPLTADSIVKVCGFE